MIADPERGEVQRAAAGESVFFRRDTWHHAFALGPEPRARARAVRAAAGGRRVERLRARAAVPRDVPLPRRRACSGPGRRPRRAAPRLRVLRPADVLYRRDLGVLCGILASTEHLTVATLEIGPGEVAEQHAHGGDEVLMALDGPLWVRAWHDGAVHVFELEAEDVCYLPAGAPARVPQPRRRDRAGDLRDRPELPAVTRRPRPRRRGDEDRRRARRHRDAARSSPPAGVPTAPARGPEAVLADCRALAAELRRRRRAGRPRGVRAGRPARARAQRRDRGLARDRPAGRLRPRRVRRARGGARRGALRRRPRASPTSST